MPPKDPAQLPPGQQLLYWTAAAAKKTRQDAGVRPEAVVSAVNLGLHVLTRFEKVEGWPRHLDRLMIGYATTAGLDDPRDIYQLALDLWREHGTLPAIDPSGVVENAVLEALEERGIGEPEPPAQDGDGQGNPGAATG